ncbi:MAG: hypothetical protein ACRCU6_10185 [Fusobacteriaceae bacterium]
MILYNPDPLNFPHWYIAKRTNGDILGEFKPNNLTNWREWLDEMSHKDIYGCTKKELKEKEKNLESLKI